MIYVDNSSTAYPQNHMITYPNYTGDPIYPYYPSGCHGCGGKGWVPVDGKAVICPICSGSGWTSYRVSYGTYLDTSNNYGKWVDIHV